MMGFQGEWCRGRLSVFSLKQIFPGEGSTLGSMQRDTKIYPCLLQWHQFQNLEQCH